MNESEAKKLRCCGPCPENTGTEYVCVEEDEFGNIKGTNSGKYLCSGSECMAWKWEYPECEDRTLGYCCYMRR